MIFYLFLKSHTRHIPYPITFPMRKKDIAVLWFWWRH